MAELERLTITMPSELATVVKAAVAEGDYASTSEVVREALRDGKSSARSGMRKSQRSRLISTKAWPIEENNKLKRLLADAEKRTSSMSKLRLQLSKKG